MKLFILLFLLTVSVMANDFKTLNGNLTKLKDSNNYLVIKTELSLDNVKSRFNDINKIKKINSDTFVIKFNNFPTTIPSEFKLLKNYNTNNEWPLIPSNRIIVKLKKSTSKVDFYQILRDNDLKVVETLIPNVYIVNVDIDKNLEIANRLYKTDLFEYSYPDFYIYHIKKFVPNDTYYSNYQWHLNSSSGVNAERAWNINRGSSSIKIAIVDDGMTIYHEDLNIVNYRDFTTNDNDFNDGGDHGTSCAGVAAAKGNNSKGVTGLCMNCSIIAAKMMHSSGYSLSSADIKAIKWSVDQGADILNNSWGYETDFNIHNSNPGLVDAINYATRYGRDGKGCIVLFASGNEDRRFSNESLEGLTNTITVGASDDSDSRSYYSNYGTRLDVVAPSNGGSRGIATTDAYSRSGEDRRGYNVGAYTATFGGTSSATPLVSGLVGLILSENSNLTYTQVKDVLIHTTQKIGSGYDSNGHSDYYGYGKIDAKKALDYVRAMSSNSNPCDSVNCQENASCSVENSRGVCRCDSGYNLVNGSCVIEQSDLCENVNCPTNSHCSATETETYCYCNDGFEVNDDATACVEVYVDPCEVTNCPNNSTCSSNNNEATCKCNSGYEMDSDNNCTAIVVDPCETTNCPENSTCSSDNNKASCYCDEGFKVNSERTGCTPIYDVCDNVNCPQNSYCTEYNGRAACFCNKGYDVNDDATACVEDDNLCDNINCGNGSCNSYNGEAFCECDEGYHPDGSFKCVINNINNLCSDISCSGNGSCSVKNNAPSCNCNDGYQNQGLSCFTANSISNDTTSEDIIACDYSSTNNYFPIWFITIFLIIILRRKRNNRI